MGLQGATDIAAGYTFTCAATSAGNLSCWGRNAEGQYGTGTAEVRQPGPVAMVWPG